MREREDCDVAIIGAGPYGLAAAAHLRGAGVETRIFGEPMESWERHMPRGMLLRSSPDASLISDPDGALTLDTFRRERGVPVRKPVPASDFVAYGRWFQEKVAPDLDRRRVTLVDRVENRFLLTLDDLTELRARRVVVATGISPFQWRPPHLSDLPRELASHAFDHGDLARFAGQRVVVVGGGQSALECAALLKESGAEVEVVVRAPDIFWLGSRKNGAQGLAAVAARARKALRPIARPNFDIMGPRVVSWLLAWPRMFHRAPRALQHHLTAMATRPAGAAWLVPRLAGVRLTTGRFITAAVPSRSGLDILLDDATSRRADHLLLATGYRVDVSRYPFLARSLRHSIGTDNGYPALRPGLESSASGLHFVGTPAAHTFGPLCRFVVGTRYAARELTRGIVRRRRGDPSGENAAHAN